MNVLSPSENIIRLLFRIQVREDKVFTRVLRILKNNNFKIIEFDETLRRITGYSTLSNIDNILKILKDFSLSYSFEVTLVLKIKHEKISEIINNIKKIIKKGINIQKFYEHNNKSVFVFHRHNWWLIQIMKNKKIIKITLLKRKLFPYEILSPYHYTFYDINEVLLIKNEILDDLREIFSLLGMR